MDMKKLCLDANTVLELLYNTYYEHVCTDDIDEIKQGFDELYNALSDKSLKEKDAIITQLRQENRRRLREKEEFLALLGRLAENYRRRTAEDADGLTENKEH